MILSREAVHNYTHREFANYVWMKKATRHQLLRVLLQGHMPHTYGPPRWLHQLVCLYIGMCEPHFLFLLDMGLGKTRIALDIMAWRLHNDLAKRGLVAVPRVLNIGDWENGASAYTDLEPWLVDCSDTEEKRHRLLEPRGDFTVVDYAGLVRACSKKHGTRWVKDQSFIDKLARRYDLTVLDESHRVSNADNHWFSVVSHLTRHMRSCYALTGTAFSRDPHAVWAQFYLVDRGDTFGENLGLFRSTFFTSKQGRFKTELTYNTHTARLLHRMMGNRMLRYEDREVMDLPPVLKHVVKLRLPDDQREHYMRALDGLLAADGRLQELDAQWFRMRQITAGYLQWKDEYGEHERVFAHNPKLGALERLLEEAGGAKLVISHEYTRTGQLICDWLRQRGVVHNWIHGGVRNQRELKDAFIQQRHVQVLVMNSAVGGTGIDGLQAVCHYLVLYESPCPPSERQQLIKRLYRGGQRRPVRVYDLCATHTVDMGILESAESGIDMYQAVMAGKHPRNLLLSP